MHVFEKMKSHFWIACSVHHPKPNRMNDGPLLVRFHYFSHSDFLLLSDSHIYTSICPCDLPFYARRSSHKTRETYDSHNHSVAAVIQKYFHFKIYLLISNEIYPVINTDYCILFVSAFLSCWPQWVRLKLNDSWRVGALSISLCVYVCGLAITNNDSLANGFLLVRSSCINIMFGVIWMNVSVKY